MAEEERFKERYRTGNTPWDIGRPDFNLVEIVTTMPIHPCKALEIGCGTGDNAIWLSEHHFDVLGIDSSGVAVQKARNKAGDAHVDCRFTVADILSSRIEGAPFPFAFDRGCFHTAGTDQGRESFAERVSALLSEGGLWLSLLGNADEKRDGPGPPQRSARDIVNAVEPYFEILSLLSGHFGSNNPEAPRAWVCVMRRRNRH